MQSNGSHSIRGAWKSVAVKSSRDTSIGVAPGAAASVIGIPVLIAWPHLEMDIASLIVPAARQRRELDTRCFRVLPEGSAPTSMALQFSLVSEEGYRAQSRVCWRGSCRCAERWCLREHSRLGRISLRPQAHSNRHCSPKASRPLAPSAAILWRTLLSPTSIGMAVMGSPTSLGLAQ